MNPGIPHPPFIELMRRFHGQMEQALYAAEQACTADERVKSGMETCPIFSCPFNDPWNILCRAVRLRLIFGDPVKQHDPETEAAALADAEQYQLEIAKQEGS